MPMNRRIVLQSGAAAALALRAAHTAGAEPVPDADPVPAIPEQPTPGRPGDFEFLAGRWRIENWKRRADQAGWDRFPGEATCWSILGGVGSVEELRIPVRGFSGMGLRLLDVEAGRWNDHWVNAKSGKLGPAGQPGSFENGVGIFWSEDIADGRTTRYVGIWDRIERRACRWRQVWSTDGGRTWSHDWVMHWRRV